MITRVGERAPKGGEKIEGNWRNNHRRNQMSYGEALQVKKKEIKRQQQREKNKKENPSRRKTNGSRSNILQGGGGRRKPREHQQCWKQGARKFPSRKAGEGTGGENLKKILRPESGGKGEVQCKGRHQKGRGAVSASR